MIQNSFSVHQLVPETLICPLGTHERGLFLLHVVKAGPLANADLQNHSETRSQVNYGEEMNFFYTVKHSPS